MQHIKISTIKEKFVPEDFVYFDDKFILYYPLTPFDRKKKNLLTTVDASLVFSKGDFVDPKSITSTNSNQEEDSFDLVAGHKNLNAQYTKFAKKYFAIMKDVSTQQRFRFEDINNFIYKDVLPIIQKFPSSFIPIQNFQINCSIEERVYHWGLQNLLFTLSLLESTPEKLISSLNRMIEIAEAMLLLDIGFLMIIQQLKQQNKPIGFIYRNPKISHILIKLNQSIFDRSQVPKSISEIVYNTHLLFINPKNKIAPSIYPSASYCHIISTYLFLILNTPNHPSQPATYAIQQILKNNKELYFPASLKNFIETIGAIPLGTYVKLKNGAKGMIIKQNYKKLNAPYVQVLLEANKKSNTTPIVVSTQVKEYELQGIASSEEIKELEKIKLKVFENL